MNFELVSILDASDPQKERVVIKATEAADSGYLAVFRCRRSVEDIPLGGRVPDVYWFPSEKVKINDLLVVYTKSGKRGHKENEDGTTSHFFYWGLDQALWISGFIPVLVHTDTWRSGVSIAKRASA